MNEQKFNRIVEDLNEYVGVEEVFLLDKEGNVKFKSEEFELSDDEAKGIIKAWTEKGQPLMFQGFRFAILKKDELQLAGKNTSQGKGNIVGSVTKDGDYIVAHTKDSGMLLEWSVMINKVAWK